MLLAPKEHYLIHLLLWQQGFDNQIFSVECFINEGINIRGPHRFGQVRSTKRLRRAVALRRAHDLWARLSPSHLGVELSNRLKRSSNLVGSKDCNQSEAALPRKAATQLLPTSSGLARMGIIGQLLTFGADH